ncbi:hypothetical protein [Pseudoruegeria sp. HB172150]|uniref:hypothetical protein n=1 Tax=Pseudoruegeria sp. HB172150 TaxID=2721164 RepID=UPI00155766DC|nr:hypothetical protein [Pseudoruegeria sp. HB172150]
MPSYPNRALLYKKIRSAFVAQGGLLHSWCQENEVAMPNARSAILGNWNGPKASALVEKIKSAAGIE